MALNLNAIKALFGKLAPHASKVAKGVANYGDDAARLVANYGDDAARAVANYGDDALAVADKVDDFLPDRTFEFTNPFGQTVSADYNKPGVWNIDGKTFHDLSEGGLYTSQSSLKEQLLNKRTNRGHPNEFIESRQPLSAYFIPPEYTVVPHYDDDFGGIADYDLVEIPGTARPHKNTALGRWYDNKIREFEPLVANYNSAVSNAVSDYGDSMPDMASPWIPNSTPDMVRRFQNVANNFVDRNSYPMSTPISSVDGLRDSSQKLLSLYDRLQNRLNLSYGLPPGTPLDKTLQNRIFNTTRPALDEDWFLPF